MQRVTQGLGEDFAPVDKSLWEMFLLDLFYGSEAHMPVRKVTRLTYKYASLDLPDPTLTTQENYK